MDKHEKEASEIHNDGSFKMLFIDFLDHLDKTYQKNKSNLSNLQKEVEKLIKEGQDMVRNIQVEVREPKTEDTQLLVYSQHHCESRENKDEENKVSAVARPSTAPGDLEGKRTSSKETVDAVKEHVDDEFETSFTSHTRYSVEELTKCKRELEVKDREIDSLMKRIAHYSDSRTKQDQRDVENTLSLNRQSRVEQDYKAFTSDERIDTCIMIREKFKEKSDINAKQLTCMIFETVYEYVLARKEAMTDVFKEVSKFVVDKGPLIGHCYVESKKKRNDEFEVPIKVGSGGSEYPRDILNGLLLSVKESAPKIDTDIFMEGVKQEIISVALGRSRQRSCKLPLSTKLMSDLNDYLKCCIKLVWRMVTQVPPMRLEYKTFTFSRELHKIVGTPAECRADYQEICYLWPGLMDGGGRIISRGEVILQQ